MKARLFSLLDLIVMVALLVPGGVWPVAATQPQLAAPVVSAPSVGVRVPSVRDTQAADNILAEDRDHVAGALGSAPLMFIENVGQFDERARFQMRGGDHTTWLAQDALWITLFEQGSYEEERQRSEGAQDDSPQYHRTSALQSRRGVNLRLSFVGANLHPRIEPFNRLDTRASYFLGNDPSKWHADVPVWGGVRYLDLYPGADLVVEAPAPGQLQGSSLSWRLEVHDDADLSAMRLRVEGADALDLDGDYLRLTTAVGGFTLPLLRRIAPDGTPPDFPAFQPQVNDIEITAPFFSAPSLTRSPALLQDNPSDLLYSTFLGGSAGEGGWHGQYSIAVDESGAAFVAGTTWSSNFPTTPGAFDTTYGGGLGDAFVVKLNATGSGLVYATFLGGSDFEEGIGITVDGAGNAYVTGGTASSDFPTTAGAFDTGYNGSDDVFVTKLTADGNALLYSTFLGGSGADDSKDIAVDRSGAVSVAGSTWSADFPATPSAYDTTFNGYYDAFVFELSADGSVLVYATFLGGYSGEDARALAFDPVDGAVYVAGYTRSSNFPTTPGAFDTTCACGYDYNDAFVVKLNAAGNGLIYATFLGGSGDDIGNAIKVDGGGSAHIVGHTRSSDFPTTPGAFDTTFNGGYDAFVAELNATGSDLVYGTFLGGSSDDCYDSSGLLFGCALTLDGSGQSYIAGYTPSSDFPTTPGAYDTTYSGGNYDAFVVKLNAIGSELAYATFLGGADHDHCRAITVDGVGGAYVAGQTHSSDFPTTAGAFDTSYNGYGDAFVTKLALGPNLTAAPASVPADGVSTSTITLSNALAGHQVRIFSSRGSVDTFAGATGTVDGSGRFVTTVRSSAPGTAIITAQDLTTGQAFATSAQVEFTGESETPPPTDEPVRIVAVDASLPLDARYFQGLEAINHIGISIDWKGTTPGEVEYAINSNTFTIPITSSYVALDLDMSARLQPGVNTLAFTAINAQGERSKPAMFSPRLMALPDWLQALRVAGLLGKIAFVETESSTDFHIPQDPIRIGGGPLEFQTRVGGSARLSLRCDQFATLSIHGGLGLAAELKSVTLGGELDVEGEIIAGAVDCWIPTAEGNVQVKVTIYGQKNWPVPMFVAEFINPAAAQALEQLVGVIGINEDGLRVFGTVYVRGELGGYVQSGVKLIPQPPYAEWQQFTVGFEPRLEAGYEFSAFGAKLKAYLALQGTAEQTVARIRDFRLNDWDRLSIAGEAGYEFKPPILPCEYERAYEVVWTYDRDATPAYSVSVLLKRSQDCDLFGGNYTGAYAVFRARPGVRQAFAPPQPGPLATGLAAQTTVTSVLVSNVYTYSEPALAVDPATDEALLVWVHDDVAKPVGQAQEIHFSHWDGSSWSTPTAVTDDALLDGAPQVAWADNGSGIAVWERLNDTLPITATWDVTTANKIEIATAVYSPTTGTWSPVALLTDDAALDFKPQLARNGAGELLAAWRHNQAGLLGGDETDPDRVVAAFYDAGWSTPAVAVDTIPGLVDLAAGYGDGAATLAFTRYLTPTGHPTPTLQLFTSAWDGATWSAPVQRTDDALGHRNPQVVYDAANQPLLVWRAGDELRLQNLTSGSTISLTLESGAAVDEFRVVQDEAGNVAAVFTAQEAQRDLYVAFYDQVHDLWGRPLALTDDRASETSPSAGLDSSGRLLASFAATAITSITSTTTISGTGEVVTFTMPVEGQTDLLTLSHVFARNLALGEDDLAVSDDRPAPGSSVVFSATVHNTGDLALTGVAVAFYDGDPGSGGTLIGTAALPAPLPGGFTATLTTAYSVPLTGGAHVLYAVADPADAISETTEADNTASLAAFGPDLEIAGAGVEYWGGSQVGLRALVQNVGTSTAPTTTLAFYQEALTGTLAISDTVPALNAGQAVTLTTPWDFGALEAGIYPLVAVVNQGGFTETFTANNVHALTLDVGPDLMVSPYYLWTTPLTQTTVAVTATVYNVGALAATEVTAGFYRRGEVDAASLLFTRTLPALPPASGTLITGQVDGPLGCGLYVLADPERALAETTRANNLAGVQVEGGRCANFWNEPAAGVSPLTVVFTDTSSGENTGWAWDLGDGVTGTLQHPAHTYTAPGAYSVTLRVSGPGGLDEFTRVNAVMVYTNTAPTWSGLPDQLFDHSASLPATLDLWAYVSDAWTAADQLTYTLEGTPPAGAGVTLSGNRTVTVNPSPTWCGGADVTVRATDPGGLWGTGTFRVAVSWSCLGPVAMPGAPVLIAPVDGRTAHSSTPAFAWHAVEGAETYRIQVDDDAGFSSPERDETMASTDYAPASGLSGGVYYWRVRAVRGSEVGAWSKRWAFTVPAPALPDFRLYLPEVVRDYSGLLERR